MPEKPTGDTPLGPGGAPVDSEGRASPDPTQNVLQLVDAAIKRQDDLRAAEREHVREVLALRSELGDKDRECAKETAALRAEHSQQLRGAEAARINAIRSVDVEAVQRAAEVQATQQAALAAQVTTSAETLRAQGQQAAEQGNVRLSAVLEPIQKDIADLRRAQYEAQGQKINVVEQQAGGGQRGMWLGVAIAGGVGFLSLIGIVVAIIVAVTQ